MRKLITAAAVATTVLLTAAGSAGAGTRVHPLYPDPVDETPCSAEDSVNIANCADVLVDTAALLDNAQ